MSFLDHSSKQLLERLGHRLRLARKRRKISSIDFAKRIGVSRDTLHRLEKGEASIAVGTYARVIVELGLESDLEAVAHEDAPGRELLDEQLSMPSSSSVKRWRRQKTEDG